MEKRGLLIREAAQYLGCSSAFLYSAHSTGRFPALFFTLGRSVRVDKEEADKLIASQKQNNDGKGGNNNDIRKLVGRTPR